MSSNLNIPKGWSKARLGDIATEYSVRIDNPAESEYERFVGSNHIGRFELKLSNWGSTSDVTSAMKVFQPGDYLLVRRSLYASDFRERAARADFEGVCSGDILTIREKEGIIAPGFLSAVLNTPAIWSYVVAHATGSITRRIKWHQLQEYEFALPPLEEQRRIAEVLQAAESCSTSLERLCKAAGEAHRALRLQLFKLDPHSKWNRTGKMPAGWEATTIGAVSDFLDGKRVPLKSADRSKRQGPYPYYGASGIIDHIDDYIFDEDLLLVSEDGANLVDRTTPIAFEVSGKIWVNNHAHVLRAKPPFSNFLIAEYIESLNVEPFVTGTAQPKINKAACEGIPIPLPPTDVLSDIERRLRESVAVLKSCRERASGSKELNQAALRELLITEEAEL